MTARKSCSATGSLDRVTSAFVDLSNLRVYQALDRIKNHAASKVQSFGIDNRGNY